MKKVLPFVLAVMVGVVSAVIYASISGADEAAASESVTWYSNPGPSDSSASLNCGWHEDCFAPADYGGSALDWQNSDYSPLAFRGWGYRSLSSLPLLMGTVYIGQRDGNCYNVAAGIVDSFGTYGGRVNFTHSYRNVAEGYSFYIYG